MIPMPLPVQKVSQMFQRRALTGSMFWYLTVTTLSPCSPSALEDDDEDEGHTVVVQKCAISHVELKFHMYYIYS